MKIVRRDFVPDGPGSVKVNYLAVSAVISIKFCCSFILGQLIYHPFSFSFFLFFGFER